MRSSLRGLATPCLMPRENVWKRRLMAWPIWALSRTDLSSGAMNRPRSRDLQGRSAAQHAAAHRAGRGLSRRRPTDRPARRLRRGPRDGLRESGRPARPFRSCGFPSASRRASWWFRCARALGLRDRTCRPFERPAAGSRAPGPARSSARPAVDSGFCTPMVCSSCSSVGPLRRGGRIFARVVQARDQRHGLDFHIGVSERPGDFADQLGFRFQSVGRILRDFAKRSAGIAHPQSATRLHTSHAWQGFMPCSVDYFLGDTRARACLDARTIPGAVSREKPPASCSERI